MPRGPVGGGTIGGNAEWVSFEESGILKRDRLVSGLIHINVAHVPHRWSDNRKSIVIEFVDSEAGTYSPGGTGTGYGIIIHRTATVYSLFWFRDLTAIVAPIDGSADEIIEVDIRSYYDTADKAHFIAAEFASAFKTTNADDDYRVKQGDITIGDEKNNHKVFLRASNTPSNVPDTTENTNGVTITQIGGGQGFEHKDSVSKETDFRQALFVNTSGDDGAGVEEYQRRSPFESNEPPPWRGEFYDDGRFNSESADDDEHPANSRYKGKYLNGPEGYGYIPQGKYRASLGDHCTFLYHMTAATRVQNNPRLWGTLIQNNAVTELLSDTGHPPLWLGDFDVAADLVSWQRHQGADDQLTASHRANPTDLDNNPLETGCMVINFDGSGGLADSSNGYGTYAMRLDSLTVVSGVRYKFTWDIDNNVDEDATAGSGLLGLTIKDSSNFALGTTIFEAPGSGTGGSGMSSYGQETITNPLGVTTWYIFFCVNPLSGTPAGGDMVWVAGEMEVNMVKLHLDSVPTYADDVNMKFGTPLANRWYTSKPDDGYTFFWVRSSLLSVHNNSEPYNDEYKLKSWRCKFHETTSAGEEAGNILIGYSGSYEGDYAVKGVDKVDNYNYRQWKNFKPGDIIKVSGAADADNNGIFQIRWDWDHNSEYYSGYDNQWPNMQIRLMPIKIEDNGDVTTSHSLVTTELVGQLFEEDITIASGGIYAAQYRDTRIPLLFTADPAVEDVKGYAKFSSGLTPNVNDIIITNPGSGMTEESASSLVITVNTSNGPNLSVVDLEDGGSAGGNDYTKVTIDGPHNFEVFTTIELDNMADSDYDGVYSVTEVISTTEFMIEFEFVTPDPDATGTCFELGAAGTPAATFTHTAEANLNVSPIITIENLTRRWQDSSNAKQYDHSIQPTEVDAPPPTGVDVHQVPFIGRYGNTGKVSPLNHMYDPYDDDFNGLFTVGSRAALFGEQHEYEGRLATHHKLDTFHNPCAGLPEIYGKRGMIISHSKNVYDQMIYDSEEDEMVSNADYMSDFSNGKHGARIGAAYSLYPSPYYDRIYNVSQMTFEPAKITIRVPIKAYKTKISETGGTDDLVNESLYDTNIEVMWQPFGETGMIKLTQGSVAVETLDNS